MIFREFRDYQICQITICTVFPTSLPYVSFIQHDNWRLGVMDLHSPIVHTPKVYSHSSWTCRCWPEKQTYLICCIRRFQFSLYKLMQRDAVANLRKAIHLECIGWLQAWDASSPPTRASEIFYEHLLQPVSLTSQVSKIVEIPCLRLYIHRKLLDQASPRFALLFRRHQKPFSEDCQLDPHLRSIKSRDRAMYRSTSFH